MSATVKIVDEISKLTVMELAELVKSLEEKFGVTAAAQMAAVAMPVSASGPAAAAEEKSEYKVTMSEAGSEKIKVIKALRTVSTLSLGAAKEAVENAPFVVAEAAAREDAQKIKKVLEDAGAKVELS
jgi:large subunit ribosomal protein L7/L12